MVPPPLRQAIQASYHPAQDTSANQHLTAAVAAVAHKEARNGPRPPQKPVQLALFDLEKT